MKNKRQKKLKKRFTFSLFLLLHPLQERHTRLDKLPRGLLLRAVAPASQHHELAQRRRRVSIAFFTFAIEFFAAAVVELLDEPLRVPNGHQRVPVSVDYQQRHAPASHGRGEARRGRARGQR